MQTMTFATRITLVAVLAGMAASGQIRPVLPAPSEVRLGYAAGRTVAYQVLDGLAVSEGDIVLGRAGSSSKAAAAGVIADSGKLWSGGVIPYVIDAAVVQPERIAAAIAEWTAKTPLTFVQRTSQANYIRFMRPPAAYTCNSWVGMIGGEQAVNIGDQCSAVGVIHELGHAAGLWHEHARSDRDQWVQMHFENAQLSCVHDLDQYLQAGKEASPYDYASVMHYYPYAFSRTGLPTIETRPAGIPIGTGTLLSAIDADAISRIYGRVAKSTTISTFPDKLRLIVDGVAYTGSATLPWIDGSTHTLSVPDTQGDNSLRYVFGRWSDGGGQTHTVTASAATRAFTVSFVRQYRTTVTPQPGGQVLLAPVSPDGFYGEGSFITMTAMPDAGFNFLGWNDLDVDETGRLTFIYQNNYYGFGPQNPRTFEVNRARDITVSFTSQPTLTVQTDPPNLWFKMQGNELLSPMIFTPGRVLPGQPYAFSARAQQDCRTQCITGTRYLFKEWADAPALDRTITWDGQSSATYTLRYRTQHQITPLSQNTTRGSVSTDPKPADGYFDEGTIVKLTAAATQGYRFLNWQNGLVDTDLPASATASLVSSCGNPWMYRVTQPLTLFGYFGAAPSPPPKPAIAANGVVIAASYQGGAVSPGAIVTIYGSDLGPAAPQLLAASDAGYFDNCAAGTSVLFDGTPAPMVYSGQGQVSTIAPYSLTGKSAVDVQVRNQGVLSNTVRAAVQPAIPALFTVNSSGAGQGAIFNQDGSLNGAANPAPRGTIVVLFATGEGQTVPPGNDGHLALDAYPKPVLPVKVQIGGSDAEVLYAGAAPGLVAGLMQVNARVPDAVTPGASVGIVLMVGSVSSRAGVTLAVQ